MFLLVTCEIFTDFIFFNSRLNNKPLLIWLLATSVHLKYAATLLCNLSLRACFPDINVSQSSVATYARRGGIFNTHLTANLPRNLSVDFFNRLNFDIMMIMSLLLRFLAQPVNRDASWCQQLLVMRIIRPTRRRSSLFLAVTGGNRVPRLPRPQLCRVNTN